MWARLPRGGICTNRLRVGAEIIKPMLMIPFIVQNLNAIGQSDNGSIGPLVISTRWSGLQAIGDRLFKNRYPQGWGDRQLFSLHARARGLRPDSPTFRINWGASSLSPFRIQVQLSRIDLSVAPWLPPSLWTRGSFLRFQPPQPGQQGPTPSFPLALYFPKNTPLKPPPAGSSRSEWRFKRAIFAHLSCIKLRSAVPAPGTKQTQNYAIFSFTKENLRRNILFFEGQKNSFFQWSPKLMTGLK